MTFEDPDLIQDFVVESREHLSSIESQLLSLEDCEDKVDVAMVNKVFRAVHSIKGAASFLGLQTLETLSHRSEEVLNRLRNNEIRPTSQVINTLLQATDQLKELLDSIETSNGQDITANVNALNALLETTTVSPPTVEQVSTPTEPVSSSVSKPEIAPTIRPTSGASAEAIREFIVESMDNLEQIERDLVSLERDPCDRELINSIFRNVHTVKGTAGFLAYHRIEKLTHSGESLLGCVRNGELELNADGISALLALIDQLRNYIVSIEKTGSEGNQDSESLILRLNDWMKKKSSRHKGEASNRSELPNSVVTGAATPSVSSPAKASQPALEPRSSHPSPDAPVLSASESTIRVDVALLDKLMTRVGELVLARNQILQFTNRINDNDFLGTTQRLNLITTELQEGVMKTRMQQIGNVWSKFPRLVRDLAATCGKEVRIEMEGKETELDKTIIEAIKDPLTHLVRNSVDHGIEKPDLRVANGKPMEGCLTLRAYHEGGQVNIEISDDGAGLNRNRIREIAISKGLITADQAAKLPERDIEQLIFLPGFSTAEKVSNVSGRGVGMDVVRTNIEKIGGAVDLQSVPGKGTTMKIKIPLTLAIIPALIVSSNGSRFAIPQVNLLELLRIEEDQSQNCIEWVQGAPVYRLRGRLLPLVFLKEILKSKKSLVAPVSSFNIVVLRADDRQFGLVVDRINDTEEIVVKPLSTQLKNVPVYSGATIMGDGRVALILDVLGIAHEAGVVSKEKTRTIVESTTRSREINGTVQTLLILGTSENRRLALPISQVARLEKIPEEAIEYTNHQEVVQYRGEILPLIRLANFFGLTDACEAEEGLLNVVVYTENDRSYGLVINSILDIIDTQVTLSSKSQRIGLLGSSIIQECVTDLVDLPAVIQQVEPHHSTASAVC